VAVLVFGDMWTVRTMGVQCNGALAAAAWLTIVIRQPFTLEYARVNAPPELWSNPAFIRTNYIIAVVWATVFVLSAALAWCKMQEILPPEWAYDMLSYAFLIGAAAFTSWCPAVVRRRRLAQEAAARAAS
jgi:hypothetical protein